MEEKTAIATLGVNNNYVTELKTNSHTLYADEPVQKGGRDKAPSPSDLLRMSLASCTAITLSMYINHKKIDVQTVKVMVVSEGLEGKTIFHRSIEVDGSLTEEQHTRLLQIANSCPIHKILVHEIEVETALSIKI